MKAIVLACLFGIASFAQTPAKPSAAQRPARTPAAHVSASLMNPAALKAKAPDVYNVILDTTKGEVAIEVHRDWAPNGADRFYNLVKAGFYNGAPFFRVLPGFVAQFGLTPNPALNRVWANANIKDDAVKQSNKRGTLTFAAASMPNTRSTQLFINLADNERLDASGFATLGKVTEGMDVVDKFYGGYGESPDQGQIASAGKAYLEKNFPQLDGIKTARIAPAPGAATPAPGKNAPARKSP